MGAPWMGTIPLPHVPPVVPVRVRARPNADLNVELDVEGDVGPSTHPPATVPAASAGRVAELTPPGAPRMRTVPLPSVPHIVYVRDNTGADGVTR